MATFHAPGHQLNTLDLQQRYWDEFSRLKRDAFYISYYHARVERTDRLINIVAAILSLGAITTWAAKNDWAFEAGLVVLVSQVITAIRPFLPFSARLKALASLGPELEGLALVAETDWLKVSKATISDSEIHKRTMALKKKAHDAQKGSFHGASLPPLAKLEERAERDAADYMQNYVIHSEPQEDTHE